MLVETLSEKPGTHLYRRLTDHDWPLDQHLLASQVDLLKILVWQKTKDAKRGSNKPKPIPRPGIEEPDAGRHGKTDQPPEVVAEYLARFAPRPAPEPP